MVKDETNIIFVLYKHQGLVSLEVIQATANTKEVISSRSL